MIEGLVSTIIPVYNRPNMVKEAVSSVLHQTYRPIEIIIVDDGSTDETPAIADALATKYPDEVIALHKENTGPGMAREVGRQKAQGEFIQYLDSDDVLMPDKFELQVTGLRNHTGCGVSYGKTRFVQKGSLAEDIPWKRTGEKIRTMFPSFLQSRWWGTSTPLYRSRITDAAGPWMALNVEEDWEYDCRIAAQMVKLHYLPVFVSEERQRTSAGQVIRGNYDKPTALRQRAKAHEQILQYARKANIPSSASEMQHFARQLFLLARQCGAVGLSDESKSLFALARDASGKVRGAGFDFRIYQLGGRLLGWKAMGKLSCAIDNLLR
jgi:glycosyltransferase involved in cell wall biosynthesis